MTRTDFIPVFTLFGETDQFPDVVHCEHISARAPAHGWQISPHRHAQMVQIFLVDAGRITATIDGDTSTIAGGEFLFIPPNKVHSFRFQPNTEGLVISVPVNIIKTLGPTAPELITALSRTCVCKSDDALQRMAHLLSETSLAKSPFRAQRAVGLTHAILGLVAERALDGATTATRTPGNDRLAAFNQLIATHMVDGWGAAQYAKALAVTPGHLSRFCRAATGKGAAAYLERAIMEEACRLLAFTQLPVAEIGYQLGYTDPSYFSKRFGKFAKVPPSHYRGRYMA